jgi:micrococcal nuclease
VKKAAIAAISVGVAVVVFIGVFAGVGTNRQVEQPTDYKKILEEGIASKSSQPSSPEEPTNYEKTLEESVSSKSTSKENSCDPSYPTVCIAPYPPDLNCKDIPYSNFQVFAPDPHGFDADSDGVGCEK